MTLRKWIVLLAVLAPAPIVSAQNSAWTYNSKSGQLSGATAGRDDAQTILNLELAEVRAWNHHDPVSTEQVSSRLTGPTKGVTLPTPRVTITIPRKG